MTSTNQASPAKAVRDFATLKKPVSSLLFILSFALAGCSLTSHHESGSLDTSAGGNFKMAGRCVGHSFSFGASEPESEGVNVQQLLSLTEWIQANTQVPILSFFISKNGHVVYQLLTSSLSGDESHYLMSVTKSVTSALVGVAIGQGHLQGPDQKISDILPAHVFASTDVKNSFSNLSLRDVLGMSALNAPVAPHDGSAVAQKRLIDWFKSQNRLVFALSQPLLARPGTDFQYTDITPTLAAGAIEYATGQSLFDYANENLLKPMGFVNQEWMHEDPSGIDNGAYGLRLRPIDMQKFGVLYLNRGCWEGSDLIPESWVEQSFTPWITSGENTYPIDYGWYWWKNIWTTDWVSYGAVGWKGQRIEVFPQQNIVVSMTALIDDGSENRVFSSLIHNYIIHLNDPMPTGSDLASLKSQLASELASIRGAPTRIPTDTEFRMVPSAAPKENHFRFNPQ